MNPIVIKSMSKLVIRLSFRAARANMENGRHSKNQKIRDKCMVLGLGGPTTIHLSYIFQVFKMSAISPAFNLEL